MTPRTPLGPERAPPHNTTRDSFLLAMNISAFSFVDVA